jgi:hypothetical protein
VFVFVPLEGALCASWIVCISWLCLLRLTLVVVIPCALGSCPASVLVLEVVDGVEGDGVTKCTRLTVIDSMHRGESVNQSATSI